MRKIEGRGLLEKYPIVKYINLSKQLKESSHNARYFWCT